MCQKCTEARLRASVNSKNFPRVIPPDPRFKGEGREEEGRGRKAKGRVGLERTERREWEGKMKGREEGRRGKGWRIVNEGWCPLNKTSGDATDNDH
jgi:hypothetical protein